MKFKHREKREEARRQAKENYIAVVRLYAECESWSAFAVKRSLLGLHKRAFFDPYAWHYFKNDRPVLFGIASTLLVAFPIIGMMVTLALGAGSKSTQLGLLALGIIALDFMFLKFIATMFIRISKVESDVKCFISDSGYFSRSIHSGTRGIH